MNWLLTFMAKYLPWQTLFKLLFDYGKSRMESWLKDGVEFSKKMKYMVMAIYVLAEGYGEEVAGDTRNDMDNMAIQGLIELCMVCAEQGEFKLPPVEEL